jgi:hypothetical protein
MNLKVNNTKFDKDKYNRLVDLVFSSLVNGGIGYKVRRNSGGTILDIRPGQGGDEPHPLKVLNASADGVPMVRVYPGTIAGKVPRIDGTPITDDPPPTLTLGDVAKIVYAEIQLNISNPTIVDQVIINSSNDEDPPANQDFAVYLTIGFVTMDEGQIASLANNVSGSQAYLSLPR